MNTTQAPRPAAADLDAALAFANFAANAGSPGDSLLTLVGTCQEAVRIIRALVADLAHTRAERDAARAALPDAQMLDSYAAGIEWEGFEASGLRKAAARIRALDTAPAPVPAADVPPFLAHRVNGGAM